MDIDLGVPISRILYIIKASFEEDLTELINSQRPESCSIKHYDRFRQDSFTYGLYKTRTRQCDIVTARIRLGYRLAGQYIL